MFRVDPKNGNVRLVREGPPLDQMFEIYFDSDGTMWFPAQPDTGGDFDVWRMKTSGKGLHGFLSSLFVRPFGIAVAD